jgi:hypothetical protein
MNALIVQAGQVVAEAAKQSGSVTLAIPTAFLSSAATLLLYKGLPVLVNLMRGKPINGIAKPGDSKICDAHGADIKRNNDAIIALQTFNTQRKEVIDQMLRENHEAHKEILIELKEIRREMK